MSTKEDRLPIIKSCLDGLRRGEAEPLFIGDIEWLVAEVERLRAALQKINALPVDSAASCFDIAWIALGKP